MHEYGGLGLRSIQNHDKALLLRLGFGILLKEEAYWVKILRAKYKVKGGCPMSIIRRNDSFGWKPISSIWDDLRDGRKTNFWTDIWISDLGPLCEDCTNPEVTFKEATVYAMTTINGEWNWYCFESVCHTMSYFTLLELDDHKRTLDPIGAHGDGQITTDVQLQVVTKMFM